MRAKIIVICGSLKFEAKMIEEAMRLELEGNNVWSVTYCPPSFPKSALTPAHEELLDKLHKEKIDLSDAIFVVNVGGYIGSSTRSEIEYAKSKGKEIIFLEKP